MDQIHISLAQQAELKFQEQGVHGLFALFPQEILESREISNAYDAETVAWLTEQVQEQTYLQVYNTIVDPECYDIPYIAKIPQMMVLTPEDIRALGSLHVTGADLLRVRPHSRFLALHLQRNFRLAPSSNPNEYLLQVIYP